MEGKRQRRDTYEERRKEKRVKTEGKRQRRRDIVKETEGNMQARNVPPGSAKAQS